jgi:hypothetical protein
MRCPSIESSVWAGRGFCRVREKSRMRAANEEPRERDHGTTINCHPILSAETVQHWFRQACDCLPSPDDAISPQLVFGLAICCAPSGDPLMERAARGREGRRHQTVASVFAPLHRYELAVREAIGLAIRRAASGGVEDPPRALRPDENAQRQDRAGEETLMEMTGLPEPLPELAEGQWRAHPRRNAAQQRPPRLFP